MINDNAQYLSRTIDDFKNFFRITNVKKTVTSNDLIIKIKDNAGGIEDNVINRIFEPYFTTKNEDQGTGIGLYMCNEIITKHLRGTIQGSTTIFDYLDNEYKGTIFTINLPMDMQL